MATLRVEIGRAKLKGRAKFMATLRVEITYSEVPKVYATLFVIISA